MKVLICYYSTYGNVYKMANLVAEGVSQVAGAEPVVRTVPELIPAAVIESRADMKAGRGSLMMVTVADLARYRLESEFDGSLGAIDGSSLCV